MPPVMYAHAVDIYPTVQLWFQLLFVLLEYNTIYLCTTVCSVEDAGRFTCVAENEAGQDTMDVDLIVHGIKLYLG